MIKAQFERRCTRGSVIKNPPIGGFFIVRAGGIELWYNKNINL